MTGISMGLMLWILIACEPTTTATSADISLASSVDGIGRYSDSYGHSVSECHCNTDANSSSYTHAQTSASGHTVGLCALSLGYHCQRAQARLPSHHEPGEFYTQIGYLTPPGDGGLTWLLHLGLEIPPQVILSQSRAYT
jgi:hypothetical protein